MSNFGSKVEEEERRGEEQTAGNCQGAPRRAKTVRAERGEKQGGKIK